MLWLLGPPAVLAAPLLSEGPHPVDALSGLLEPAWGAGSVDAVAPWGIRRAWCSRCFQSWSQLGHHPFEGQVLVDVHFEITQGLLYGSQTTPGQ